MKVTQTNDQVLKVSGRIDSSNAQEFERELKEALGEDLKEVTLDLEELTYISSAGLRVLMKLRKIVSGTVTLANTLPEVTQVLEVTGFSQLFRVHKAYRRVNIEGCPVIGKGFYGTVYRLDADTIVKVYRSADSIPLIENEQRMAKAAFFKGIPTAISYDIVRVGDSFGSVFEMLKAESFNDLVINNPDQVDDIVRRWSVLLHQVHDTVMSPGVLPSARQRFLDYLHVISPYLLERQEERLRQLMMTLPDSLNVIHGDYQMKNVMLSDNEPMLIDMDTLATGHPIFDFAGLYVAYKEFEEDEPGNSMQFLGISADVSNRIWQRLLEYYFETTDPDRLQVITDKIRVVAAARFLFILAVSNLKNGPLGEQRIRHTQQHLAFLLDSIDSLFF